MPSDSVSSPSPPKQTGVPGTWVVFAMFAFGFLATGILFAYWHWHTAPFQELQAALAKEFPGCRPRVEGGQHKSHKNTTRTLRVVLKVDFPPDQKTAQSEAMADRVLDLAASYLPHPLTDYDVAEVHLYWPEKEKTIHEHLIERKLKSPAN